MNIHNLLEWLSCTSAWSVWGRWSLSRRSRQQRWRNIMPPLVSRIQRCFSHRLPPMDHAAVHDSKDAKCAYGLIEIYTQFILVYWFYGLFRVVWTNMCTFIIVQFQFTFNEYCPNIYYVCIFMYSDFYWKMYDLWVKCDSFMSIKYNNNMFYS